MAVQTVTEIKQADLQQIHDLQAEITDKQSTLDKRIDGVKQLMFAKAPIEPGRFDAVTFLHENAQRSLEASSH